MQLDSAGSTGIGSSPFYTPNKGQLNNGSRPRLLAYSCLQIGWTIF